MASVSKTKRKAGQTEAWSGKRRRMAREEGRGQGLEVQCRRDKAVPGTGHVRVWEGRVDLGASDEGREMLVEQERGATPAAAERGREVGGREREGGTEEKMEGGRERAKEEEGYGGESTESSVKEVDGECVTVLPLCIVL